MPKYEDILENLKKKYENVTYTPIGNKSTKTQKENNVSRTSITNNKTQNDYYNARQNLIENARKNNIEMGNGIAPSYKQVSLNQSLNFALNKNYGALRNNLTVDEENQKKFADYQKSNQYQEDLKKFRETSETLRKLQEEQEKEKGTWFNSGAFKDGYQFGDITKTALSTVGNIATGLTKGVTQFGEGIGDLAAYGGAQIIDWLGAKDYANQVRQAAAESLTDKIFKPVDKVVNNNSLLGQKSQGIVESIGNMYAQGVTAGLVGKAGNLKVGKLNLPTTSLISGASSGMSEAVNKGAEDWQIWLNGIGSGLAEGVSESLFGTFGIGGSDLDDAIVKGITKNMKDGLSKSLAKAGIKAVGEGTEEIASYLLNYAGTHAIDYIKNTTGLKGVDLGEKFNSEELWENFFSGAIASGIAGIPSAIGEVKGNNRGMLNTNEGYGQDLKFPTRENTNNTNLPLLEQASQQNERAGTLKKISKWAFDKIGNLKSFKEQLSDYQNNLLPSGTNLIVSDNSANLEYANIADKPIVINQSNIKKILVDKHSNIDPKIIENLDLELNNSVFAMDSISRNDSRVIVLNKEDINGNPIIASINLNKSNASIEVNEVTSVYDKREFQDFINRTIENNKNIYTNEKTEQWLLRNRLQLPTRFTNSSVSYDNDNSTNNSQSQIAPLPTINNMQENAQNIIKNNLNTSEQAELDMLNNIPFDLTKEQSQRKEYLENKSKGLIKYSELPQVVTYEDIKTKYSKYKDLSDFNNDVLNNAKSFVPGYQNTERRTKQQWLEVAKIIGNNLNAQDSETLEKYAIQSWHSVKPNSKENLNRQGKKYVKFTIDEWINEIYKSAGVGETIQEQKNTNIPLNESMSTQNFKIPTSKDVNKVNLPPVEMQQIQNNKILNPLEISQLNPEDANTTPPLPTYKAVSGEGESSFFSNVTEKSKFLNEDVREILKNESDIEYYKEITNKDTLSKAYQKLQDGGKVEALSWFDRNGYDENGKYKHKPTAEDVAEGWILLKQYQDAKDYDGVVQVAKKMREIGTQAGQTVQAFNIMQRLTPEGMVKYAQSELQEAWEKMKVNKTQEWINKHRSDFDLTPDDVQFIMDNMKEVATMEDGYDKKVKLAEIQKLMTDKLPPTAGSGIKSWMRISMLFNPKTQARNVAGNAIIMPVNSFSDLFSSYADKLISKKTGVRTTGKTNIKAMLKGMKEGAYQATNDYKKGINTKDMEGNRFEIGEGKSFNDKTLMGKSLNRVEGMLNYVMDAGDRMFSQAAFENSLQNQLVLNNTTEVTPEMLDIARTESLQRTWNDNNNYTRFVLNIRKGLNQVHLPGVDSYGLGDILIPFAKTPANLTKAIVDYSPAGLVKTIVEGNNLRKSLTNGQYTPQMQHQFVQDLGKATAGTMLYVLGYALAKSGITSGESDDDKDVSNFMKNTLGISSYSIKIGNKSFTYDWAQPIAAPLSITANIVNSKNNKGQALLEGVTSSLDTAGSILLEQSFLQSINDVLNSNDGFVSGLFNEILELPSRAVPTFSKQIAELVDDTQRTSFEYNQPLKSAVNSVIAKIPFASKTLAPSVDSMGREIKRYGGKNNLFNVFLNPANVNTENISESAEEIYKIYKSTGDSAIMPRVAPYYVNSKGEKIIMNSEQRAEYQKIAGNIIEHNVQLLMKNNEYVKLNDSDKASMIKSVVDYSYNKARKDVLDIDMSNTYNKVNEYVSKGGEVANYYLQKDEINYSLENPDKYETITQITKYDDYQKYKKEIDTIREKSSDKKSVTINYINSLKLNIPQKAMFIKLYYSSFNNYNNEIIDYINNQKMSVEDKSKILKQLGFEIKDGRVYW